MPKFRHTSRDNSGATLRGVLDAPDAGAAAAALRADGLLVLDIAPVAREARGAKPGHARKLDVETGFHQLASMLGGGLTLLAGLRTVGEQARTLRVGATWHAVADQIEQGSTFTNALASHPRSFPDQVVQLIRVGESSGNLDLAMRRAAEHLERLRQMRLTVINALAYPAVVTVLSIGVASFLVFSVIPKMQKYLGGRGRSLPALTTTLLDVVAWIQHALPYLAIGLVAAVLGLIALRAWPPGRLGMDSLMLRVPVIGKILRLAGTATFARGLGVLIDSGVTLLDGLATTARLLGNRALRKAVMDARDAVMRGGNLATPLATGNWFMPMLPRMVAVGENAGTLTHVLDEVSRFTENQLLASIRRMSMLIEPIVIIVVGGIVGFVYIAFFLALFSLAGGIR